MSVQYFETMGVLFGIYVVARLLWWWELRVPDEEACLRMEDEALDIHGHAFDSTLLAGRVEQVRRDYESGLVGRPASFKKPLLVEQRREELEKLPYFQHLAESAHPDDNEELQPSAT